MNHMLMQGVTLVVVVRSDRAVDGDLVEVGPAQAAKLRVGVGEQPPLQQGVVGKVDTRHDMTRAERHLFHFSKEVVRVAIQDHLAQRCNRHQFFRDYLGRVQQVEIKFVLVGFRHNLHTQFPFRVIARLDSLPQVATLEISILACQLLRFVP
ncbi:hypothetical protein D3C80_1482640 [compost metagenome]